MGKERLYTFNEVLERLLLTDEELLLCKQHTEYAEKLDDMFSDHPRYDNNVTSTGDLVEKPKDMWSWYKDGGYYGA
jgi:hypothetical protein